MIGIFDSGVGGLTVASAIRKLAPRADLVYFGDLANMPFGEKSETELLLITKNAIQFLIEHGATEIVAACNSISLLATSLQSEMNIPLIEMSEPTVRSVLYDDKNTDRKHILVVATEATVKSEMYKRAFDEYNIMNTSIAVPKLAPAIERFVSDDELRMIILPIVEQAISIRATTLLLGCTQYPFAKSLFQEIFHSYHYVIEIFDPSLVVAEVVMDRFNINGEGSQTFFTSKPSVVFDTYVRTLFKEKNLS